MSPSSGDGGSGIPPDGAGADGVADRNNLAGGVVGQIEDTDGEASASSGVSQADEDVDAAAAVDECVTSLVLETCKEALAPRPPLRPNSRGFVRPSSVQSTTSNASNGSVGKEVNQQVGDLMGGLFEAALDADEHARQLVEGRASARVKASNARAKAHEAGEANARERRESESRRAETAAAVKIQAVYRGGLARAEVLNRWLAVYQAQRFWRGAVARRRVARMKAERRRGREADECNTAETAAGAGVEAEAEEAASKRQEIDAITAAARAARVNAAAQRGTSLRPALSPGAMGPQTNVRKPPLPPRAVALMFDAAPSAQPPFNAGGTPPVTPPPRNGKGGRGGEDDGIPEWASQSQARAEERNAELFAEIDAALSGSRNFRKRLSDKLEVTRTMNAMLASPRKAESQSNWSVTGTTPMPDVGSSGHEGSIAGNRNGSYEEPLPAYVVEAYEAAHSTSHTPKSSPGKPSQRRQSYSPTPQPQQSYSSPSRPQTHQSPQTQLSPRAFSDAFAKAATVAPSSQEDDPMSQYAALLAAAMCTGGGVPSAGKPPLLRPVSGKGGMVGGRSRPGSGRSRPASGEGGSRPISPVTPAGKSAMLRAETAQAEEERRLAVSLHRIESQQRFATSRADTIIRRCAATPDSVVESPLNASSSGVYESSFASDMERADSRVGSSSFSSHSSGFREGVERKLRAVRFKPAKKKAAALSPNRPESLYGEPPSWSPSAAKVLATDESQLYDS